MDNQGMPHFTENEEWYYYDEKEEIYKLTKEAPPMAIISYNEFYSENDNDLEEME